METQIRHGDVFLRRINLPAGAVRSDVPEPAVLAYGEVTGHCHRVVSDGPVTRWEVDRTAFVLLEKAGLLTHPEHGEIALEAGAYQVLIERDYDPTEYQRRVVD